MSKRTTGKHPKECDACLGFGQNEKCATRMREDVVVVQSEDGPRQERKLTTTHLGSGCLKCGGTGRLK